MGKSIVFHGSSGEIVGYMQCAGKALRCGIRIAEQEKPGLLFVLYMDGTVEKKELEPNQADYEWFAERREIAGGCIVIDGRIIADSGIDINKRIQKLMPENKQCDRIEENEENLLKPNAEESEENKINVYRWPRNPCCMK